MGCDELMQGLGAAGTSTDRAMVVWKARARKRPVPSLFSLTPQDLLFNVLVDVEI